MRALCLLPLTFFLAACAGTAQKPDSAKAAPNWETEPEKAQLAMCIEENVGLLRFARGYLEEFCPKIKQPLELTCLRLTHATKDWHKACPGIDTPEKLECLSTVANGTGYALLASLEKCRQAVNRKQVYCLSQKVANSAIPLEPETVQGCLDANR